LNGLRHPTDCTFTALSKDGTNSLVKVEVAGASNQFPSSLTEIQQGYHPVAGKHEPLHTSSVILNFTMTSDGRQLLLNGQIFAIGMPDSLLPPPILALHVVPHADVRPLKHDPSYLAELVHQNASRYEGLAYEYFLNTSTPSRPRLSFTIVGMDQRPEKPGWGTYLDLKKQRTITLTLREHNNVGPDHSRSKYTIEDVTFGMRSAMSAFPNSLLHNPDCKIWSWRCEDYAGAPWYSVVWWADFDQYGRKGSMRHYVLEVRATVSALVAAVPWGFWMIAVGVGMVRFSRTRHLQREQKLKDKNILP